GGALVAVSVERTLVLWDTAANKQLARFESGSPIDHAALSADGRVLAVPLIVRHGQDWRKLIRLWDVRAAKSFGEVAYPEYQIYALPLSADGRTLAVTGSMDNRILLYETHTAKQRAVFRENVGGVSRLAFSPDGRLLASGGWDNRIRLID